MNLMQKVVSLAKRRGFVYPTSEIYGGLISSYDYGPTGAALLRNIKNCWWSDLIESQEDMVGIDTQIILHPKTWEASGHVDSFNEPLVEDTVTNKRYRADHLVEAWLAQNGNPDNLMVEDLDFAALDAFIEKNSVPSPEGNQLSKIKKFNQLFKTQIGAVEDSKSTVYLRGETAQGIFSNFQNITDSTRVQLPFGVGQIGKSFRNEITTGQFIFRTLEFEQGEIEYFFDPESSNWQELLSRWQERMMDFLVHSIGLSKSKLRWRRHTDKERSHYSLDTYDLDYEFPFGFKELWGLAYRADYDLRQHSRYSGRELAYFDAKSGRKFIPHVIEPAIGINRLFLAVLCDGYHEQADRVVLKISPRLSPFKVAVFPLVSNKPQLVSVAREIYDHIRLKLKLSSVFDDRGNIGKRYYSQDEIGTPWCITVDYQTLTDRAVTVRDRDTTAQIRLPIAELDSYLVSGIYSNPASP